jgi:hypothetical protein
MENPAATPGFFSASHATDRRLMPEPGTFKAAVGWLGIAQYHRETAMQRIEAVDLAREYLRLGGKRKAAADDNAMSIRLWQDEPEEADTYWNANIATLPAERRKEVESHLPSISGDSR